MGEKKTRYEPKYINTRLLKDTEEEIDGEEIELVEGTSEEIVSQLKEEVKEEIDSEHGNDQEYYEEKDEQYSKTVSDWKDRTEENSTDEEDIDQMTVEEIDNTIKGKSYDPGYSTSPTTKPNKFPLGTVALIAALFWGPVGIILGLITIATAKGNTKKRMKGVAAVIIGFIAMSFFLGSVFFN